MNRTDKEIFQSIKNGTEPFFEINNESCIEKYVDCGNTIRIKRYTWIDVRVKGLKSFVDSQRDSNHMTYIHPYSDTNPFFKKEMVTTYDPYDFSPKPAIRYTVRVCHIPLTEQEKQRELDKQVKPTIRSNNRRLLLLSK